MQDMAVKVWLATRRVMTIERDDRGASLVEYALLVALIAVVCIAAVTFIGNNASNKLSHVGSTIGG